MTTRAASPARMTAQERREQLLDATKAIVDRAGFHAVSIEAVAREAGITRPIVYSHFHDLPSLLEALVDREGARALAQLATVVPSDLGASDIRELLLAALHAYLRAAQADPVTWRLVLMPAEGAPAVLRERIESGRAAVVAQLTEAVRPGFGPGRELPDPELAARLMSVIADEFARLLLGDPEHYPIERLVAQARWFLDQVGSFNSPAA